MKFYFLSKTKPKAFLRRVWKRLRTAICACTAPKVHVTQSAVRLDIAVSLHGDTYAVKWIVCSQIYQNTEHTNRQSIWVVDHAKVVSSRAWKRQCQLRLRMSPASSANSQILQWASCSLPSMTAAVKSSRLLSIEMSLSQPSTHPLRLRMSPASSANSQILHCYQCLKYWI